MSVYVHCETRQEALVPRSHERAAETETGLKQSSFSPDLCV